MRQGLASDRGGALERSEGWLDFPDRATNRLELLLLIGLITCWFEARWASEEGGATRYARQ